jgi:hypothetical protein
MELLFLSTTLPLNVLDNCMKLYWIPKCGFQVNCTRHLGKVTKGNNAVISKDGVMVLVLCTALPLNVLDHCMKLYWIPTISLQVMLRTKKAMEKQQRVITL